jgi:hypothetical protein
MKTKNKQNPEPESPAAENDAPNIAVGSGLGAALTEL